MLARRLLLRHSTNVPHALYSTPSNNDPTSVDVAIIGGGIVGCASAMQLQQKYPQLKMVLLEKEHDIAQHQSGRNSGVLHAGLYYLPNSLRAQMCVRGIDLMYDYMDKNNIPYKKCGKLVVATNQQEVKTLETIFERATINKCRGIRMIDGKDIKQIEPYCAGLKAIHSPHTGIVDFGLVTKSFAKSFQSAGGTVKCGFNVNNFILTDNLVRIEGKNAQPISAKYVIVCGGLHADRLARLSGGSSDPKIVPFRGEYLLLKPDRRHLIKGNIYPVPDPRFPFLGVHFTPRMNGDVWLGPNAVLAYAREGYSYWDINVRDLAESLAYRGLQKLAVKYFAFGISELARSFITRLQVNKLKQMVPELKPSDVTTGPTGVRAQALGRDGSLIEDFVFDSPQGALGERMLHVRNAPSPACTSSLAIAETILQKSEEKFHLV